MVLLAVALEVAAVVLGNRSLQPDPKGGLWRWLAVTAILLPVALLFVPVFGLFLALFIFPHSE